MANYFDKYDITEAAPASGNYFDKYDPGAPPAEPRSLLKEVPIQAYAGATIDLPKQFGQALQWMSSPGEKAYQTGKEIQDWATTREASEPDLAPQVEGRGFVGRALSTGARAIAPSTAIMIPAAIGAAAAPVVGATALAGAAAGGAAGAFGLFGASQAQDTYDKLLKAGVDDKSAREAGWINLMIEGGGETAGTIAGLKLFGLAGKAIAKGMSPVAGAIAGATETAVVKPFLRQLPKTLATEMGTEFGQNFGEAWVENKYGAPSEPGQGPLQQGVQGAEAALGMTILLAPFGLSGFAARAKQNERRALALEDPTTPVLERLAAATVVYNEIAAVDKDAAKAWSQNSTLAIVTDSPIILDETTAKPGEFSGKTPYEIQGELARRRTPSIEEAAADEEAKTAAGAQAIDAAQDIDAIARAAVDATSQPIGPDVTGLIGSAAFTSDQERELILGARNAQGEDQISQAEQEAADLAGMPQAGAPWTAMQIAFEQADAKRTAEIRGLINSPIEGEQNAIQNGIGVISANGQQGTNGNELQARAQAERGINRETAPNDAGATGSGNQETADARGQPVSRNDRKASADASQELSRAPVDRAEGRPNILGGADGNGAQVRAQGNNGEDSGAPASSIRARTPQEFQQHGQQPRQPGAVVGVGSQTPAQQGTQQGVVIPETPEQARALTDDHLAAARNLTRSGAARRIIDAEIVRRGTSNGGRVENGEINTLPVRGTAAFGNAEKLPGVSRQGDEGIQGANGTIAGPAQENGVPLLRPRLPETGQADAAAVPVRQPGQPNAPSGLQSAAAGRVDVSGVSLGAPPQSSVATPLTGDELISGRAAKTYRLKDLTRMAENAKGEILAQAETELNRRADAKAARPMTPKQVEHLERLRKKGLARKQVDNMADPIETAVAKLGGLAIDQRPDILRDKKGNHRVAFVGAVFSPNGRTIDEMVTLLAEHGYISPEGLADVDGGVQELRDKLGASMDADNPADKHYSQYHDARDRQAERDAYDADQLAAEIERQGGEAAGAISLDVTPQDLQVGDLDASIANTAMVDLAAKAAELDPDAFERATMKYENDDAGFAAAVKEIINAHQSAENRQAGEADRGATPVAEAVQPAEQGRVIVAGQIQTTSGRLITAPPTIRTDSNQKATADVKRVDAWLLGQGIAEATARNDDFAKTQFKGLDAKRLSPSDKDTLNEYLFGETDPQFATGAEQARKVYNPNQGGLSFDRPAAAPEKYTTPDAAKRILLAIENGLDQFANFNVSAAAKRDATAILSGSADIPALAAKYGDAEERGLVQGGPVRARTAPPDVRAVAKAVRLIRGATQDAARPDLALTPISTTQQEREAVAAAKAKTESEAEAKRQEEADRQKKIDAEIKARNEIGAASFELTAPAAGDKKAMKAASDKAAIDQLAGQGGLFQQSPVYQAVTALQGAVNDLAKAIAPSAVDNVEPLSQRKAVYNEDQLELIYDDAETRPGTTQEQKTQGIHALRALFGRDRRAGGAILGSRIWKDFQERKGVELIGQEARTPRDLATLAQILRDPRFETLRFFFVKDGKIVEHTAVTSRLPAAVSFVGRVTSKSPGAVERQFDKYVADLKAMMKAVKADGYYMLHNHPSGRAIPSDADVSITQRIAEDMPGFMGHVIIDHNEYAEIGKRGTYSTKPIESGEAQKAEVAHDMLGQPIAGPVDLVEVAKGIQARKGFAVLIGQNGQEGRVSAIAEIPESVLSGLTEVDRARAIVRVRRFGRFSGSQSVFVVSSTPAAYDFLIENGVARDVVSTAGESRMSKGVSTRRTAGYNQGRLDAETGYSPYVAPGGKAVDQTQTEAFKAWSNNAPLVRSAAADAHEFKTGEKVAVEAFHGTQRPDRVGTTFKKSRATSGPMAYHTSDPALASSYATGKSDTSLNNEDTNYETWFRIKMPGARNAVNLDRAWYQLSAEERDKIASLAPRVGAEYETGDKPILHDEGEKSGLGGYDQHLKEARGNHLKALIEEWLSSGSLFNDEIEFMKVLKLAGVDTSKVEMHDPGAAFPFVYKNYIAMQNPLVTNDIPQRVTDALNAAAKRDRTREQQGGDTWDKARRTLRSWVEEYNRPNDNEYVWTSIPDKVTDLLKSLGYDGIIDKSGKGGGAVHPVYVPFHENQIKSAIGNKGTYRVDKKDIRYSQPWYYSALARGIETATMKSAPAAGWKSYIQGLVNKGTVKQAEIEATGINDWLDTQAGPQPIAEPGFGIVEEMRTGNGPWEQVDDLGEYARTAEELEKKITPTMRERAAGDAKEYGSEGRIVVKAFPSLDFGKTATQKVTKEQVQAFMELGGVKVTETVLGGNIEPSPELRRWLGSTREATPETPRQWQDIADILETRANTVRGEESRNLHTLAEEAQRRAEGLDETGSTAASTKFADYQLPGSVPGSYRELVLTLPPKAAPEPTEAGLAARQAVFDKYQAEIDDMTSLINDVANTTDQDRATALTRYHALLAKRDREAAAAYSVPADTYREQTFESGHFPNAGNYLAHTRVSDFMVPAAGVEKTMPELAARLKAENRDAKILMVNEFQGDRRAAARRIRKEAVEAKMKEMKISKEEANKLVPADYGWAADTTGWTAEPIGRGDQGFNHWQINDAAGNRVTTIVGGAKSDAIRKAGEGIPRAPFVGTADAETALLVKRILRYAAEGNYDAVAWTRGDQQVEFYQSALRKAVDTIEWKKTPEGVQIKGYKGKQGWTERDMEIRHAYENMARPLTQSERQELTRLQGPEPRHAVVDTTEKESALSDAIGKSMADKIRNDPNQSGTIEGDGITVSDTGMSEYYDRIVPGVMRDVLRRISPAALDSGKKAVLPEKLGDSGLRNAKQFANIGLSKLFSEKGFDGLDANAKRVVKAGMLAVGNNSKILDSVIGRIPVNVMNILRARELTPEMFFHDPTMLEAEGAMQLVGDVTATGNVASALVRIAARATAENVATFGDRAGPAMDNGAALGTIEGKHGVTPSSSVVTGAGGAQTLPAPNTLRPQVEKINISDAGEVMAVAITPAMREKIMGGLPLFRSQSAGQAGMAPALIKTQLAQAIEKLTIQTVVHDGVEAARKATGVEIPDTARAMYHGEAVHLFADSLDTPLEAETAFWHEVLHAGLSRLYGTGSLEYERALTRIASLNRNIRQNAAMWRGKYGPEALERAKDYGMTETEAKRYVVLQSYDEALADLSGANAKISGLRPFLAAVQQFLRSIGLANLADAMEGKTDAEALAMIVKARNAVMKDGAHIEVGSLAPAGVQWSNNDAGDQYGSRAFWDNILRQSRRSGEGYGLSTDEFTSSLAARDRRTHARGNPVILGEDQAGASGAQQALSVVYWPGAIAGQTGHYSVASRSANGFVVSFIPEATAPSDDNLSAFHSDAVQEDASVLRIGFTPTQEAGTYVLSVNNPEPGGSAFSLLQSQNRLTPTGRADRFGGEYFHVKLDNPTPDILALMTEAVRRLAISDGAVPVIIRPERDTGANANRVTIYSPEDVVSKFSRKSAIGNRGTFDPNNPDIRFSQVMPKWVEGLPQAQKDALVKAGVIVQEKTLRERFNELRTDFGKKFTQGVFDQFAPLKELDYKAYMLARMSRGSDGGLEAMMMYGRPYLEGGALNVGMEDGGLLNVFQGLQGEHDRFLAWIAGNRAAQLKSEGRENLFTDDDISALKDLDQGDMPDGTNRRALYAKTHRQFNSYMNAVLDIAEETGLIDAESRGVWAKDFYVPFYRAMEDGANGPTIKSGLVNQYAFKKLKGGSEGLKDLMANTLVNWSHLLSASLKNQAADAALTAAEAIGAAHPIAGQEKGAVSVMKDGERVWYEIDDPFLLDAITAMEWSGFKGPAMEALGKFKRALTTGVTVNPTFKIRNLIRDTVASIAQGDLSYNAAKNMAQGWRATAHSSQTRASMMASGGLMRFGTLLEGNTAEHTKRLINAGIEANSILDKPHKVVAMLQKMWDTYQETGDRGEQVNRAALYEQLRARGLSHLEASFQARDLLDFSMQGQWSAIRFLTQVVPFMNARLQGMYKLGRAAAEDPKRMAYVIGALSLASMALLLWYKDDDDWKKREDWDRDQYWWFKIGKQAFRIPKPFEVGALASVAERSLEFLGSSERDKGKRFMRSMGNMISNNLSMNPIPQLVKPLIDVYANKDSFTGRPIETQGMENLSKGERIGRGTTLPAQILGKLDPTGTFSPVQVDFMARAYFGWLGTAAMATMDYGARPFSGLPGKPEAKLRDFPVIGNFTEGLPANQSRYVTLFYDEAKDIHEAYADWRNAIKMGNAEKAGAILKDKGDLIRQEKVTAHIQRVMGALNQQERRIEIDKTISPQEKRARIDAISAQKDRLAKQITQRASQ